MNPIILSLATRVGSVRNESGALTEPELDELDLGIDVAGRAFGQLSTTDRNIDRVVFAYSGVRPMFPSAAISIANALKLDCIAFDITAACAAMGIAVEVAAKMGGRSLIVGADCMSRTIDLLDPTHRPFQTFADGAAALIIGPDRCEGPRIISQCGLSEGRWRRYYKSAGGKVIRSLPDELKADLRKCYVTSWTRIALNLLRSRTCSGNLWIYANQGDKSLFPRLLASLGLSSRHLVVTEHGHAGGADPWIGLDAHPIPQGDSAILLASGVGFEFHGTLIEHQQPR